MIPPFYYLKLFIKEKGITEWLLIKQNIFRSYHPYRFLRNSLDTTTYDDFKNGMMLWAKMQRKIK